MIENHLLYHVSTDLLWILWTEASEKIFRATRMAEKFRDGTSV
jgi:hypothetical protein